MTLLAAREDPYPLVHEQTERLDSVVQRIASRPERQSLYAELTARRDAIEPLVNALEMRRETCPEMVSGPLNGLPITVKDQIAVADWPRSHGLERVSRRPDNASAPLVERLQALGACVTAKTALPPHAMDFQTRNRRRSITANPYNPHFTPGGSTGGGAAAVASGMSLMDVGSDLSGSLRIPAAWCGVSSYTPTEGLWPNAGMLPGSQTLAHFARIGLIAQTASDLSYIWHLLEPQQQRSTGPSDALRIALWSPDGPVPCDRTTLTAWTAFAKRMHIAYPGTSATPMNDMFDEDMYRVAGEIIGYETGALMPWLIRWILQFDRRAKETSPSFVAHIHEGYKRDRKRHEQNLKTLADLRHAALDLYAKFDALLLPVSGVCAFEHIAPTRDQGGIRTYDKIFETDAGKLGYFDALTRFTLPLTLLGWPVVTLPIARDGHGIPMGAQLVGKPGADGRLFEVAKQLEEWI